MKCFLCGKPLPPALVRKLERNGYTNGLCRECAKQIKKGA
jgi:hypothetical protein